MKNNQILRVISLFAFFLVMASSVFAQDVLLSDMTHEEKAEAATEKQNEQLQFYADQEQQMYDINLKYINEMETIMAGGKSMSTMMKLRNMGRRRDKEVKEVLDKDQYKMYEEMKEEMKAEMKAQMQSSGN